MLDFYFINQFKKDMKLAAKRRYDINTVYDVLTDIIFEIPLPDHCRPHKLSGNLAKYTECHALNDVLLLYEIDEKKLHSPDSEPTPIFFNAITTPYLFP